MRYADQKIYLITFKPKFQQMIVRIRKKWKIPQGGFPNISEQSEWNQQIIESDQDEAFNFDFDNILRVFNLTSHYRNRIYEYLVFGSICELPVEEKNNLKLSFISDKENPGKERIFLEIFSDTSKKDIDKIWPRIEIIQKSAAGFRGEKKRNKANLFFVRDIYIFKLYENGKTYSEIREIIKNMPGCNRIYTGEISKIIAKIKRKIKTT